MPVLHYCGGLADPEKKKFINVTGGDRVFRLPNKIGATIECNDAQAKFIMNSHQIIRKEGAYAAFTDNKSMFDRMLNAQNHSATVAPKKMTKAQLLAALQEAEEEEAQGK